MRGSSKSQAPSSREAPSSKQISKCHAYEDGSPARCPDFGIWNLEFLWSLELGTWNLELPRASAAGFRAERGSLGFTWGVGFGIWSFHPMATAARILSLNLGSQT